MTNWEYVWLPEDETWTTDPAIIAGKTCRQRGCDRPAVAALNRGMHLHNSRLLVDSWWCYCDLSEHLYRRRVRNGVVEHRYLVGSEAHREALARAEQRSSA